MSTETNVLQQISELKQQVQNLHLQLQDTLLYSKPILTFSEFCRFASISEHSARTLKRDGKIPFTRPFDRKLYIDRETAIAVLMQNPISSQEQIERQANQHLLTSKTLA